MLNLGGNASLDAANVSAGCLREHLPRAINLMAEVIRTPTFPASEFEKIRKQVLTGLAISAKEPAKAFELEKAAAAKLKGFGVKIVEDVDKKSFATISDPYLDKLAKELGPHAEKIKNLIRAIN